MSKVIFYTHKLILSKIINLQFFKNTSAKLVDTEAEMYVCKNKSPYDECSRLSRYFLVYLLFLG